MAKLLILIRNLIRIKRKKRREVKRKRRKVKFQQGDR